MYKFKQDLAMACFPDVREAEDLVKRMQEDLEYFRQHAMTDPHRTRKQKADGEAAPDIDEGVAELPEEAL